MDTVDFIAYAEKACFEDPWDETAVRSVTGNEYGIVTVDDGKGYALGRISFDEAELYRIAVLPEKRGNGTGRKLLDDFIAECTRRGAVKIFLEVRSRNVPAISLYEHAGFVRLSVRKGYYPDDDAVVYIYEC